MGLARMLPPGPNGWPDIGHRNEQAVTSLPRIETGAQLTSTGVLTKRRSQPPAGPYAARRSEGDTPSYVSIRSFKVRRIELRIWDTRDSLIPSIRPTSAPCMCFT
jgi:hypothetical protein